MPSSHPIPTIAALALSLFASDRRVEKLPRVIEYNPRETVLIVSQTDLSLRRAYESIGGDL